MSDMNTAYGFATGKNSGMAIPTATLALNLSAPLINSLQLTQNATHLLADFRFFDSSIPMLLQPNNRTLLSLGATYVT